MPFKTLTTGRCASAACLLAAAVSNAVHAQTPDEALVEEVVVRAHPLAADGLAQPIAVLTGQELERALAPSIGETLQNIPGVHNGAFGQAVGRPVIRGLAGPRVKVMQDRIDSLDVSVSSPDHMTMVEPFVANSIEVLKGPSTLLYGTGAIGGVVNVETGRVPQEIPEELTAAAELRGTDNAEQRTAAFKLDGGAGNFAFHVDAFYRDADEYEIPGFAESAALRAMEEEEEDHGDEDHDDEHGEEEEEAFGVLPGSQMEAQGGSFGASYIGDRGFFGLAVSTYEAEYGLPGHGHDHDHDEEEDEDHDEDHDDDHGEEEEEGQAFLDLEQTRIDLEGGLEAPFAGVRSVNFRLGYNDYEHVEFEGNGEAGTRFATEAWESRIEFAHDTILGFDGVAGLQVSNREFSALGEEAFVRPVDTQTFGIFYVGERQFGELSLETGVRYENVDHDPSEGPSRSFDVGAASLGLIQSLGDNWTLSGQVDVSSRAPVAEELYSDGPHLATNTYEIGDPTMDEEVSTNLSATLGYQQESLSFSLTAFATEFSDYIYEQATGMELDELPVLQWSQQDASFSGFEADATWQAMTWREGYLAFNAGFDTVRARFDNGDNRNVPRISPQRWRVGAMANWKGVNAELSYRFVDDQDDAGLNELPTDGFDDLRLHIGYAMNVGGSVVEFFLNGRNLTDDEQRLHTSFIKDLAPQPGRTIEGGVQVRL
ncbi:MAG: TonB-dependent receptor [Pseudomonadota bacterium]